MADYCGGESCCPTTEYATCANCGNRIERYPKRQDDYWRHGKWGSEACPPPKPKAPGTLAYPVPSFPRGYSRGRHLRTTE